MWDLSQRSGLANHRIILKPFPQAHEYESCTFKYPLLSFVGPAVKCIVWLLMQSGWYRNWDMKLDNTEWSLGSGSTSSFIHLWPVWTWSTTCNHFILLIARLLQLNLNFVLKRQMEIESFVYPAQLQTNQKCRLPFCCTASAFLIAFCKSYICKESMVCFPHMF